MRKRLAAMQDWPLLMQRARTASWTASVEVGRGHDDEGIAAAEFEDGLLDEPSGLGGDGAAGGFAAGEGDGGDALVGEHHLHLAGFDEQRLERAAGKAGAAHQGFDGERALGHVGGVLEQADVAGHQRGREEAEDLPEGEVPGHDGEHDAERIPAHVGVGRLRCRRVRAQGCGRRGRRSSGRRLAHLTISARDCGDGLAHLGGDERGEFGGFGLEQSVASLRMQSARWLSGTSA